MSKYSGVKGKAITICVSTENSVENIFGKIEKPRKVEQGQKIFMSALA